MNAWGRDGYILEGLQDARRDLKWKPVVAVFVIAIMLWIGAYHVVPALLAKDNPPLACQLFGGTWNLWDGWGCG